MLTRGDFDASRADSSQIRVINLTFHADAAIGTERVRIRYSHRGKAFVARTVTLILFLYRFLNLTLNRTRNASSAMRSAVINNLVRNYPPNNFRSRTRFTLARIQVPVC